MPRSPLVVLSAVTLLSGLLLVPISAAQAQDAASATTASAVARPVWAALGDSYASGEGAGEWDNTGDAKYFDPSSRPLGSAGNCARSGHAAARIVATRLPVDLRHIACTGAKLAEVTSRTQAGQTGPQVNMVPPDAKLITISIGGNDAGFGKVILACMGKTSSDPCRHKFRNSAGDTIMAKIRELGPELTAAYKTLAEKPSRPIVLVTGYPQLIAPFDATQDAVNKYMDPWYCGALYNPDAADRLWLRSVVSAMNQQIAASVAEANRAVGGGSRVRFIDNNNVFETNPKENGAVCGSGKYLNGIILPSNVDMTGLTGWNDDEPFTWGARHNMFHPTRQGWEALANRMQPHVAAALAEITAAPPTGGQPAPPAMNQPPRAAFSWWRVPGPNNGVAFDGSRSTDSDGRITSYVWTSGSQRAEGPKPVFHFGSVVHPRMTLTVTDDDGRTSSKSVDLHLPNRTPVIKGLSPAQGTVVGSTTPRLDLQVSDDDADVLTFTYSVTGPRVNLQSGPVSGGWTVPDYKLDPGTSYSWTVTADDGRGGTTSRSSSFTVASLPTAADVISTPSGKGYWQVASDGGVFSFGDAQFYGSVPGIPLRLTNIMGMARTPSGKGYWLVGRDGGVFSFGDAAFFGSLPGEEIRVNNIVAMSPTPTGQGYWLAGSDGGVFSFGDAGFFGSMGDKRLNEPVVSMVPTPTGRGYLLAAADGGVFTFGDAQFQGSMGDVRLNAPVVDMDATARGDGYWLVAEDGGVFTFGAAGFHGSLAGYALNGHITGMSITPDGRGYWLNGCDGGVFTFGNAPFLGANPTYHCRGVDGEPLRNMPPPQSQSFTEPEPVPPPDTTTPFVSLLTAPAGTAAGSEVSIEFTADDAHDDTGALAFTCSLDGAAREACTSPFHVSGAPGQTHTLAVRARDPAGNEGDPVLATWTHLEEGVVLPPGSEPEPPGPAPAPPGTSQPKARTIDGACPSGRVPGNRFADVPDGSTHERAITCLVWWEVANGRTATSYVPSGGVTRDAMAAFVARTILRAKPGSLSDRPSDAFEDDDGSVHQKAINQLAAAGIVGGTGGGNYSPATVVTRGQMAKFLANAAKHVLGASLPADVDPFSDDSTSVFQEDINRVAQAGLTGGRADGTYDPGGPVLRDQMGSFLARTLDLFVAHGSPLPEP